jgi:hypothetical protein
LGLPSGLFSSRFPTKTLHAPLLSLPYSFCMLCPSHASQFDHPNSIWWGVQIIQLLIMRLSQFPCKFVPLRPKYSPLPPILKHPRPKFLPQCERPSFTPIQNNRQNYSSVYLNLYIFG